MDYSSLVDRSFRLAWNYKSLWVLGLFASYGSANFSYGDSRLKSIENSAPTTDPSAILAEMAPYLAVIIWLGIMMLLAYCLTKPALIDAVNRIARGGVYRLSDSFSTGVSLFFRFLGLTIVSAVMATAAFALVVFFFVMMFAISPIIGILLLLPGIPILLAMAWLYVTVFQLAERALVVRNSNIADSIMEGWYLFRNHLKESAIMMLIFFGLSIGVAIAAMVVMLVAGAPITVAVMALNLPLLPALIAGFIMALPVAIVVGGFVGTAMTALYTLFYFELVEPGGVHTDLYSQSAPMV
jgi:hypothetical protein